MNEYHIPVSFIDLKEQQALIKNDLDRAIQKVLDHGQYIMGPEVKVFEKMLEDFVSSRYAISCANGTDALSVVLMAWNVGQGDAVFVPSFTYVASAEAPAQLGATPFFVDVDENSFNIDPISFKKAIVESKKIGLKPKVVIAVDLFGRPSDIEAIIEIAHSEKIKVLTDAAQSFGSKFKDYFIGSLGDATTTSFFPAKPLGCYGDGGAIFTNSDEDHEIINSIKLHGKGSQKYDNIRVGLNSRLDTIQAAILIEKLKIFPNELRLRQKIATKYNTALSDFVITPSIPDYVKSAWAQYTIIVKKRDKLKAYLHEQGIPSIIYYPIPLSKQIGYSHFPCVSSGLPISENLSKKVLSLPMSPYMSDETIYKISDAVINFSRNEKLK
tara:strand:+ start:665 stop:1813 length:1149 start_codon:yes stop_codon:yes gene_type:complete